MRGAEDFAPAASPNPVSPRRDDALTEPEVSAWDNGDDVDLHARTHGDKTGNDASACNG